MFKRKRKHTYKATLEIQNMDDMKQLVSEAQSLIYQLENELSFYKEHKNKLQSLTTRLDSKVKEINSFKPKAKIIRYKEKE
ncbi:hypothetical protein MUA77_10985 [Mammaliicoccus sciuri]|uniref:hypothetical protein n=1 Tax=Mammaliicoccus sciuri TaxID=1296 RepID=UPI0021D28C95|nr:hypothetical protein [Mammaliicoccus sciuri]UXU83325.1 hypothetical protein MUA77_10985 [Mammaliicoccus sciuri]UXU93173.1 hypothetical protein MUA42_10995 [Mammaliicoccus sciuri]UXV15122.1 hypothetical protein MUA89_11260 [Mammaliicoccus sciuri]UXV23385.1 hypothetical protein MUA49_10990 [Mammaliicoccus sciuri]UXV26164.1 hypothetical protein MUA96_11245 [Mammaliicoccus sciuri]